MENQLNEIVLLLAKHDRPDLQIITLENILALTGTPDVLQLICQHAELLKALLSFLGNKNGVIAKQSALILVNISSHEKGPVALLSLKKCVQETNVVISILKCILNPNSDIADACCMILSNITRPPEFVQTIIESIQESDITFDQIVDTLTKTKFSNKGQNLFYLGPVLSNLSQSPTMRKYILDKNKCVIQKLLPFTEFKDSIIKKGGIVGTLRNCCFDVDYHSWLLSEEVDILPRLLLPLAGSAEFDDEDNDKLPLELQYLPEDKAIEEDPDIRCMLLEAVTQLCAKRENREYIRNKNTYVILRELHKSETDRKAILACENLVNILIRTEDEIAEDNLKDITVPKELQQKFVQMDEYYQKN